MASTYLTKTLGTPTNNKIWTFSAWVKRAKVADGQYPNIFCANSLRDCIRFHDSDKMQIFFNEVSSGNLFTNRLFRDVNAWYHIVVAVDTTQATASNRVKLYVNGVQETSFSTETYPSQNYTNFINSAIEHRIGKDFSYSEYYKGSMSHIHFIDGTQYSASDFGSTDATTGEWKINTSPSVTYGNNGFFILKDGNSVTDQSGNGNNFTVSGGTLTKTEDSPSNVFATWNPLVKDAGSTGYYHGNTQHNVDTANWRSAFSTLGMTTGKYYFEALKSNGSHGMIGIRGVEQCDGSLAGNNDHIGVVSQGWGLYNYDGVVKNNDSNVGSSIGTYANGDYMGCFLDCDNSKLYFSKNGTMMNTTGYSITAGLTYMFSVSGHSTYRWVCNFGNGAFGSTQLTGTTYNGSDGNGIFKYNPNSITLDGSSKSFKSLSTKGLNL